MNLFFKHINMNGQPFKLETTLQLLTRLQEIEAKRKKEEAEFMKLESANLKNAVSISIKNSC